MSSVSVYGSGDDIKSIDQPLNPKTFYGISKMRGEEHVRRLQNKCETYIVRCGNVYGYNKSMRFDAVINKFLFEANFHGKINIHGNGEQHRPFVHIDSVTRQMISILNGEHQSGTFNLIEHNYSVNNIVEVLQELNPNLEIIFINNNIKLRELKVDAVKGNMGRSDQSLSLLRERMFAFKQEFTF